MLDVAVLTLEPNTAAAIVAALAGAKLTREESRTLIDGVVVEWGLGTKSCQKTAVLSLC